MGPISLKWRFALLICAGFAACCVWTTVISLRHAAFSVRNEMDSALSFAADATRNEIAGVQGSRHARDDLRGFARAFQGNRHVSVDFRAIGGPFIQPVEDLPEGASMPDWFRRWVGVEAQQAAIPVTISGGRVASIILSTDPRNETLEVWNTFSSEMLLLALFLGAGILAILGLLTLSLRPITTLSTAIAKLGAGDYTVQVAEDLPAELAPLARSFNGLARRLGEFSEVNLLLAERLDAVQEMERRDLANDLHDQIGPYLFAMGIDATRIQRDAAAGKTAQLLETASGMADAVIQAQQLVRGMLTRLREFLPDVSGIQEGIEQLVAFWRRRYPETDVELVIAPDWMRPDGTISRTLFRIVQESLCNAFRHGQPTRISVRLEMLAGADQAGPTHRLIVEDNGHGVSGDAGIGFGLRGMAERVRAVGGTLNTVTRPGGGFIVDAAMPRTPAGGFARSDAAQ